MKFNIITIFPDLFESPLKYGLLGQSLDKKINEVNIIDLRQFAEGNHRHVDDRPFGGGDGMIMMAEPLAKAIEQVKRPQNLIVYLSPQGEKLNQSIVEELAKFEEITFICGRYGGVDQRFINQYVDREISVGDYVLNGGEFAALVVLDSVARVQPEVVGNPDSLANDSFANGLLEGPSFTKPRDFMGQAVPQILLSGDHQRVSQFKKALSVYYTKTRRPDLAKTLSKHEIKMDLKILRDLSDEDLRSCGVEREILEDLNKNV